MTTEKPTNLPASVRARLKNKADEIGLDFNQVLQYYAMERFLYRLSKTKWADCLIVKGAAMLRVWDGAVARPTRDIDFLGRIVNSPEAVAAMVRECLAVESADGVEFSADVAVEPINIEDRYPGVRALVETRLAGARMRLQLDIGVADIAVPEPGWVDYPTLLDMDAPHILAYQPATAIAEKFETMISKGLLNSRVKDYYDIWMLSRSVIFDGSELTDSIAATFGRRGTDVPFSRPAVLSDDYAKRLERMTQWTAFVTRLGVSGIEAPDSLVDVVDVINVFIMPPATAAAGGQPFSMKWVPGKGWS
ncbi:MAG: nucleotidyl transferase AbiEii/AbiGii toxin family protein [Actinomycetota bacterium]|nr:nucleotidyl transferase AbiEii/AbiGii toxin family protein [Actinomycetota bacterium]